MKVAAAHEDWYAITLPFDKVLSVGAAYERHDT